jgi:hypothetical protein
MALYLHQGDPSDANEANDNCGSAILASCTIMVSLAAIAVIVRMYVRMRITRSVGLDDHTMILAMVS